MNDSYQLEVAGLTRRLPLCPVNDDLYIGAFIMFSDVELTVACAKELLLRVPGFDVILTAESKGIPLAYEMSRQCGKNYVLARKSKKLYMHDPVQIDVSSITTSSQQVLYLDQADLDKLTGRRILIVDDVVSTGNSLAAMEALIAKSGGKVTAKAAVLAEGDAAKRDDLIYLARLPLFNQKGECI